MSNSLGKDDAFVTTILSATKGLYQQFGYKKVSMDDVAKKVGKTRSALYYYFKNRDELFEAVLYSLVDEVEIEILAAMEKEEKLEAKLSAYSKVKIDGSTKQIQAFYADLEAQMGKEEHSNYAILKAKVHEKMMVTEIDLLTNIISVAVEEGEIPPFDENQLKTILFVFLSSIRGIRREVAAARFSIYQKESILLLSKMIILQLQHIPRK